jgi:hypothetical protein
MAKNTIKIRKKQAKKYPDTANLSAKKQGPHSVNGQFSRRITVTRGHPTKESRFAILFQCFIFNSISTPRYFAAEKIYK